MNTSAYSAAIAGASWRDMSHFGRFLCTGKDAATLLHHLTTNDVKALRPGQGCDAALITNHARLLDWITIYRMEEGYLVVTSPNRREMLIPHAAKFILFRQDAHLEDITGLSGMYGVFGPTVDEAWAQALGEVLPPGGNVVHSLQLPGGAQVNAARTSRLPGGGILAWSSDAQPLQQAFRKVGPSLDAETYNVLRVEAGLPVAGLELTEDINPWEARLDAAISLSKGCYNGQEIVARLHTYKKVKQLLFGLRLSTELPERTLLTDNGRPAGVITSAVQSLRFGPIALGYVKAAFAEAGKQLQSGDGGTAVVTSLPFSSPLPSEAPSCSQEGVGGGSSRGHHCV